TPRFFVVLGKNYRLFWRGWIQTLFVCILPILLSCTLIFLRNQSTRKIVPSAIHWRDFHLDDLPLPPPKSADLWTLAYAPNTSLCNEIIATFAPGLSLVPLGFPSEDLLLDFIRTADPRVESTLGAVLFDESSHLLNMSYTIRLRNGVEWSTSSLYPKFAEGKPRTFERYGSPPDYYPSGFLSLQLAIDRSITRLLCGNDEPGAFVDVNLKRMPYPPYLDDGFIPVIQRQLAFVIVLGFMFPVLHAVRSVLTEKQRRIKETLKMLGVSNGTYWCSWFLAYLSLFMVVCVALTAVLCVNFSSNGPLLTSSNPFLIFMLLFIYAYSLLTFGFAVCSLFNSPHTGTAICCAVLIAICLPSAVLDEHYEELNLATKVICSFLPSVGMGFVCLLIGQFEGIGVGVQFSNLFTPANPGDNLSLHILWMVLLVQGKLFMLIALYVDAVWPGTYGVPKPWHFPFTCLCRRKPTVSITLDPDADNEPDLADITLGRHPLSGHSVVEQGDAVGKTEAENTLPSETHISPDSCGPTPSTSACPRPCYDEDYIEAEPVGLPIGIALKRIRKVYRSKNTTTVAVSGLTMNVFQGQITVLLGHNGAGKTTTLSILTGLYPPTSGTAFVSGHDIRTDIEGVRQHLGFCPQHDVYFKTLTVEEHLKLVARLKGFHGRALDEQVTNILHQTHLTHKRHAYTVALSGGMRRRLSIGMALIGDSKVVILDEPTSGLDPEARRQVWAILQAQRAARTLLVTTHYMDEADHLGDRIAIMSAGKLRCFGSPLFLKAKYGAGYLLTIMKSTDTESSYLLSQVQQHVKGAQIRSDQGDELKFLLPLEAVDTFSPLFSNLETNKAQLGIQSFGVSVTTMEEVFLRVSERDFQDKESAHPFSSCQSETGSTLTDFPTVSVHQAYGAFSELDESMAAQSSCTYTDVQEFRHFGAALFWQQLSALLTKRCIYMIRHPVVILSQFCIPFTLCLIALFIFRHLTTMTHSDDPCLALSLAPYGSGLVVTFANEANDTSSDASASISEQMLWAYNSQFDTSQVRTRRMVPAQTYEEDLLAETGEAKVFEYRAKYIIGLVVQSSQHENNDTSSIALRGYFQGESFHSAPVALNALSNAVLRLLSNRSSEHPFECPNMPVITKTPPRISTFNQPLPRTVSEQAKRLNTTDGLLMTLIAGFPFVSNVLLALSYLAATFALPLIYEYTTNAKHLQFVSGVKLLPYWLSNYLLDMLTFLAVCASIVATFAIFNLEEFDTHSRLYLVALLLLAFAWAILPQMYLLSRFFKSPTSGLVWITVYNEFSAAIGLLTVAILCHPAVHQQSLSYSLERVWIILSPTFSVSDGLFIVFDNYVFRRLCDSPEMEFFCHLTKSTMPCCLKTCKPFCAYWTVRELSFDRGAIGLNLYALIFQGLFFNILVLFLDSMAAQRLQLWVRSICARMLSILLGCGKCAGTKRCSLASSNSELTTLALEDEDVRQHRHLIESMPLGRLTDQTSLVLRHVTKTYGPVIPGRQSHRKPAVDCLTLAVLPAECFGLLGVNGAGKTTAFRMLTGDLDPTEGDIFVNGFELKKDLRKAQQCMGYCPQFDALLPYLTGRETLQLYARLRGIPEGYVNVEVNQLLHDMRLSHHANVLVAHYSGGKRRKVSVAVALVGGTPIVCLDEPTTGVDPVSRRCVWNLLLRCRRQGRTLVLSSHSMEECEALCSRVSIVVNGRLKCLGTCQHLKSRFGRGYSLTMQVAPSFEHPTDSSNLSLVGGCMTDSTTTSLTEELNLIRQNAMDEAVLSVTRFVDEHFPNARLVARHQGVLQYHLPMSLLEDLNLSGIFHLMESNKIRLGLINYSVSQTTLEQVFIDLAKLQEEHNENASSSDERYCTCFGYNLWRHPQRFLPSRCCHTLRIRTVEVPETESLFT
ncbi:ABC transporter, ATP-binding protein, partial [Opisthorchis viverrini]